MDFYREQETQTALENCFCWGGDGVAGIYGGCTLNWSPEMSDEERQGRRASYCPPIGEDASFTARVLDAMEANHVQALRMYHVDGYGVGRVGIALSLHRNTATKLLADAHCAFWSKRGALAMAKDTAAKALRELHVRPALTLIDADAAKKPTQKRDRRTKSPVHIV